MRVRESDTFSVGQFAVVGRQENLRVAFVGEQQIPAVLVPRVEPLLPRP